MENRIAEDDNPKLVIEKMNNSESERLKSSKDQKEMDTTYGKLDNVEMNKVNENEEQHEEKHEDQQEDDEENLEINEEYIEIEKKTIDIEKTTVIEVLKETTIEEKENFELLKISLNFLVNKEYKWVVYRTPSETHSFFKKMYKSLKNDELAVNMGFTNSLERIKDYKDKEIFQHINEIKKELDKMLQNPYFKNNNQLNEFFNIGGSSFSQYNGGVKPFEGWGEKKADPHCMRKVFGYICKCLECCIFKQYNQRWIVLKDDMITYSDLSASQGAKHAYFFDEEIRAVRVGKTNIKITNLSRSLELKFKNYFERELWKQEIEERIKKFKQIIKNNKYKAYTNEKQNNYVHWFVDGQDYFEDLFQKLMGAKKSIFITDWWMSPEVFLKRPVLESDYKSFFKRKSSRPLSRLMDVLEARAKKGVKVYILLYYECSLALTLNSKYTQETLEKLHKNISVARHPTDKLDLLWSHHEKLVIIDQQIGYVGGLDLCWGRYDYHDHPIYEPPNSEKKYYFPFIDYSNARICDFSNVEDYLVESVSREGHLRMPWHDVHTRLIGPVVSDISRHFVERWNHARFDYRNDTSINIVKNSEFNTPKLKASKLKQGGFLDQILESVKQQMNEENRNNSIKEEIVPSERVNNIKTIKEEKEKEKEEEETVSINFDGEVPDNEVVIKEAPVFLCQNNSLKGLLGNPTTFEENEKNQSNESNLEEKIEDSNKIKSPNSKKKNILFSWKTFVKNEKEVTRSVYSGFEDVKKQWMENFKEIDEDHILVPRKLESKIMSPDVPRQHIENQNNKKPRFYSKFVNKIKQNKNYFFKDLFKANNELETIINDKYVEKGSIPANVQVLRSVGEWSLGLKAKENSILEAYYQLIENSKHYIYIENQFFISKSFEDNGKPYLVENKIALYIRNRILKAAKNKEKFRVYIFIPLLPGFAGEPEKSGTLQIILKYTYEGICRNNGLSIIEKLKEELDKVGEKWEDYIGFYSLRNHALVNGIPKTEIIYIHSKLMIIDDAYVICGSANINDRSMKGSRDSEFAALIKERRKEMSIMNKKSYKASNFASSLRKALMAEHLGINKDNEILLDPLSDELHELIRTTAHNNTFAYHQVFGCYPDDCYTKFNMIKNNYDLSNEAQENYLIKTYDENKHKFVGHIVEFPLHFLEEEELGISFFSKENLVPERNFT